MLKANLKLYREGKVEFLAPDLAEFTRGRHVEPAWAPVFYNPRMRMCRDISVAIVRAFKRLSRRENLLLVEPLSATGIRGLRYAAEVDGCQVIINDIGKEAYQLMIKNVDITGLGERVKAFNEEANLLLRKLSKNFKRPDVVDIDPFGSPAPFIDSALSALNHGGLLLVTATDLPPLYGIYPSACLRKYSALSLKAEFFKEIGVRILLGFIAREAAKLGKGVVPLFSLATDHYIRLAVRVYRSKSHATKSVKELGFVAYCPRCLWRSMLRGLIPSCPRTCPRCGRSLMLGGPLWIGDLWQEEFAKATYSEYISMSWVTERGKGILAKIIEEMGKAPLYFKTDVLASKMGLKEEISARFIVEKLSAYDPFASLTHFDTKGFRSSLHPMEILKIVKCTS